MSNLAIIPARGGSKRIKNKNIQLINGKEIIKHTIDICKKTEIFDKILITSDNDRILKIAKEENVDSIMRESELCDDYVPLGRVMKNTVMQFPNYDNCCLVLATAVMLNPKRLIEAQRLLDADNSIEFVIGVKRFESKISRRLEMNCHNMIKIAEPANINKRSQDLEDFYYDAGAFSFGRTKYWIDEKHSFKSNTKGILLDRLEMVDIDEIDDLELVRRLMK